MIEGQLGTQPLNGCDARALLGIIWDWIEQAESGEAGTGDLRRDLMEAGYRPLERQGD